MPKKQRVKFHKGDRRPRKDNDYPELKYRKRMVKKGKEIFWRVTEYPTKNIISEYFLKKMLKNYVSFKTNIKYGDITEEYLIF
jgi:hypothetical protein